MEEKIIETSYSIVILDSGGAIYDEVFKDSMRKPFASLKDALMEVILMKQSDKELGECDCWDYRVVKHEVSEKYDYQSIYKVYRYRNKWMYKFDDEF